MANDGIKQYLGPQDWSWISFFVYTELLKYQKAVEGKGLSTNDFTDAYKELVDNAVQKDGNKVLSEEDFTTVLKNKLDAIDISQYSTTEEMTAAINASIAGLTGFKFEKPENDQLPETGAENVIYLISNGTDASGNNIYTEYYWDGSRNVYETLGSTVIDLSNYLQKTDIREMTSQEMLSIWQRFFPDATLPTS